MILAAFYTRSNIESVCTTYVGCSGYFSPGSPLENAFNLLNLVTVLAAPIAAGGLAYALGTGLQRSSKWAAVLITQPLAQHLQQWYAEGKMTKQQADEILADLTSTLRR